MKKIYYRLPCDQFGQPTGQIEAWRMTEAEYYIEKKFEEKNHIARWFDNYAAALARADN